MASNQNPCGANPDIAGSGSGNYAVVWESQVPAPGGTTLDIFLSWASGLGQASSFSAPLAIATGPIRNEQHPCIVVTEAGQGSPEYAISYVTEAVSFSTHSYIPYIPHNVPGLRPGASP